MKYSLTLAAVLLLSVSAHARTKTVSLECSKTSGFYPAKQITVETAVSPSGNVFQVTDDPNGYRLDFTPVSETEVNLKASRAFGGTYYSSEFSCTENLPKNVAGKTE